MAKNFADALKKQLEIADVSGYRLSQMIGVSKQTVSKLLLGQMEPSWDTVVKISAALQVQCDVFLPDKVELPDAPDQKDRGRPAAPEGGKAGKKRGK